jgi:hypothetical protein
VLQRQAVGLQVLLFCSFTNAVLIHLPAGGQRQDPIGTRSTDSHCHPMKVTHVGSLFYLTTIRYRTNVSPLSAFRPHARHSSDIRLFFHRRRTLCKLYRMNYVHVFVCGHVHYRISFCNAAYNWICANSQLVPSCALGVSHQFFMTICEQHGAYSGNSPASGPGTAPPFQHVILCNTLQLHCRASVFPTSVFFL